MMGGHINDNDSVWELDLIDLLGAKEEPSSQQLTLYIPHKDCEGREVENIADWIMEARRVLTVIGGGSTTMPPADGTWLALEIQVEDPLALEDDSIV